MDHRYMFLRHPGFIQVTPPPPPSTFHRPWPHCNHRKLDHDSYAALQHPKSRVRQNTIGCASRKSSAVSTSMRSFARCPHRCVCCRIKAFPPLSGVHVRSLHLHALWASRCWMDVGWRVVSSWGLGFRIQGLLHWGAPVPSAAACCGPAGSGTPGEAHGVPSQQHHQRRPQAAEAGAPLGGAPAVARCRTRSAPQ